MHAPAWLATAALLLSHAPAGAVQPVQPIVPRFQPEKCQESAPDADEIVVCGQSDEDSPYRIPRELRYRGQIHDRNASWDARVRDLESIDQYSSQTVGPFGYLQRGRQMTCEYIAARQQSQGRQIDCTRKVRPNEATDWQRR